MKAGLLEKLPELPEGFFWRIERMPYKWFWLGVYESGSDHPFVYGSILAEGGEGSGKVIYAEILTDELVVNSSLRILEAFEEKRVALRRMEEKRAALEALEEAKKASLEYIGDYVAPVAVEAKEEPDVRAKKEPSVLSEKGWEKVRVADLVTGDLVRIMSADGWCRRGPWVVEVGKDADGYSYAFDSNDPGRNCIYDSYLVFSGEWLERPVKVPEAPEWEEVSALDLVVGDLVCVSAPSRVYFKDYSGVVTEVGRSFLDGRGDYLKIMDGDADVRTIPESRFGDRSFKRRVK